MVAKVGLEPTRPFGQGILNPQRLPIPPLGLSVKNYIKIHMNFNK